MTLPPELELNFKAELERFEAEQEMTYITSIERIGVAPDFPHPVKSQLTDEAGLDVCYKKKLLTDTVPKAGKVPA